MIEALLRTKAPIINTTDFLEEMKPASRQNIREFVAKSIAKYNHKPPFADVACGYRTNNPEVALILKEEPLYIAFDIASSFNKPTLPNSSPNLRADAERIPLPTDSCGTILCTEALEHIDSELNTLMEIRRILKPNGILILTVPGVDVPLHEKSHQQDLRRFDAENLCQTLTTFGFEVEECITCHYELKEINILIAAKLSS